MIDMTPPPTRQLSPLRLEQRREHLIREISSARPRHRSVSLVLAGAALATVLVIAAAAVALGHSPPRLATSSLSESELKSLSQVSASGTPFALPQGDLRTERLNDAGYRDITLLGSRGDLNFFRLTSRTGTSCYAQGRVGAAWPFAVVACRAGKTPFPSPAAPVLDMSLVGSDSTTEPLRYMTLAGVAADGVAAIEGVDPQGSVVITAPVKKNVYYSGSNDVPDNVLTIEAVDDAGNVLDFAPR